MVSRKTDTKTPPKIKEKMGTVCLPDIATDTSPILQYLKISRENKDLYGEIPLRYRHPDYDPVEAHRRYLVFCAAALDELNAKIEDIEKNYVGSSKEQIFPYLEELSENNIPIPPGIMLRITGLLMGKKNKRGRPRQTTSEEEEKQKLAGMIMGLADAKGRKKSKMQGDFTPREEAVKTINRLIWGKQGKDKDHSKEINTLLRTETGKVARGFSQLALKKIYKAQKQEMDKLPWPKNKKEARDLQEKINGTLMPLPSELLAHRIQTMRQPSLNHVIKHLAEDTPKLKGE